MRNPRRHLVAAADRAAGAAVRTARRATRDTADADLVIGTILARPWAAELSDPAAFARLLNECLGRMRFRIRELRPAGADSDVASLRFQALLDQLSAGPMPVDQPDAVRIGRVADELSRSREPFEQPTWAADVGLHHRISSSFGRKGRLLVTIARMMRVERAVEIGTAYGMSALFLAAAMGDRGQLVTIECSEPQLGTATAILEREHADTVAVLGGLASELVEEVGGRLGSADLLFHDGGHSGQAYIQDFEAFESLLAPGAVVLYDDIDWQDDRFGPQGGTYEGWRQVAAHRRVRRAVEVDRELGMLLLG